MHVLEASFITIGCSEPIFEFLDCIWSVIFIRTLSSKITNDYILGKLLAAIAEGRCWQLLLWDASMQKFFILREVKGIYLSELMPIGSVRIDHEPHFDLSGDFLLFVGGKSQLPNGCWMLIGVVGIISSF